MRYALLSNIVAVDPLWHLEEQLAYLTVPQRDGL